MRHAGEEAVDLGPDQVLDLGPFHPDLVLRAVEDDQPAVLHLFHLGADHAGGNHDLLAAEEGEDGQGRQRRDVEARHLLERGIGPLHGRTGEAELGMGGELAAEPAEMLGVRGEHVALEGEGEGGGLAQRAGHAPVPDADEIGELGDAGGELPGRAAHLQVPHRRREERADEIRALEQGAQADAGAHGMPEHVPGPGQVLGIGMGGDGDQSR
jgi:hypothetical protein